MIRNTSRELIPRHKREKRPCLKESTIETAKHGRLAKVTGNHDKWGELDRAFNLEARKDMEECWETQCEVLEHQKGDSRKAFTLLKEITGKRSEVRSFQRQKWHHLTEAEAILNLWAKYCRCPYKEPSPSPWISSRNGAYAFKWRVCYVSLTSWDVLKSTLSENVCTATQTL